MVGKFAEKVKLPHRESQCTGKRRALGTWLCLVLQLCLTLCDPTDCSCQPSVHGDSPVKNTGVGCHDLLQGLFSTQGLNPRLPHCRWILYHLSH